MATLVLVDDFADRLDALAGVLADDALRVSLYAGVRTSLDVALANWLAPDAPGNRRRLAVLQDTGALVGGVRVGRDSIYWFVGRACSGRGLGTEMVTQMIACLDPAETPVIDAAVARENAASRRIAAKTGFAEIGLRHRPSGLPPLIECRRILSA